MPTQSPPPEDGVHVPLTGPEFDVVAALMRLEVADAGIRSRLRERLALNPTDLATVQYLARADAAGQDVHAKDLVAVLGVGQPAVRGSSTGSPPPATSTATPITRADAHAASP